MNKTRSQKHPKLKINNKWECLPKLIEPKWIYVLSKSKLCSSITCFIQNKSHKILNLNYLPKEALNTSLDPGTTKKPIQTYLYVGKLNSKRNSHLYLGNLAIISLYLPFIVKRTKKKIILFKPLHNYKVLHKWQNL